MPYSYSSVMVKMIITKTGRLPGHVEGIHLNDRGQKQAQALAEALKELPIKAMYSSPLERAMETAEPIARIRGVAILPEPDLRDANVSWLAVTSGRNTAAEGWVIQ